MAGGTAAAVSTAGLASAEPNDTVKVNVGFASDSGRDATIAAADEVVYDFEFDAATIRTTKAAADQLGARSDVRYVEEDGQKEIVSQTLPWGIDRVDADVAHANGETGNGADIAIIDTGIDDDHPDLADNLATPLGDTSNHKAFTSCSGRNCNYNWSDDHDHGTHCSGTADAVDNSEGVVGVSTQATLHAAKVCDKAGFCDESDIAGGIEWAADQGFDVASLSLGGDADSLTRDAVQYAYDKGVLIVAAAGNDGPCSDCVGYPAAYDQAIAVSATSSDDTLADFSSTGPEVELAAPGENVYSSVIGGYDYFDGTSMATPHVSGAGGQLMANGYTNTDARSQLQSTAEDIGLASNEQGHGLLDVAAALGLDSSDN
jgi:subtilisin